MLRPTQRLCLRLSKGRRPKERAWEFFNVRSFGIKEGGQNYRIWAFGSCTLFSITAYELYQFFQRLKARGDTCPACEAVREQRRMRRELAEKSSGI